MVAAQTPTLAKIKNKASEVDARALLYIAICEVCDFFNVGKNMNDTQVAVTIDLILESFWHLRLEEIKYCFRRAMMREKLFDRLDGNIIMGWLREYDTERTEEAIRISEQRDLQQVNETADCPEAVSFEDYVADLRNRALKDEKAAEVLKEIDNPSPKRLNLLTNEERVQKDHDFRMWRTFNYLSRK
jgi:hypothetical protein